MFFPTLWNRDSYSAVISKQTQVSSYILDFEKNHSLIEIGSTDLGMQVYMGMEQLFIKDA